MNTIIIEKVGVVEIDIQNKTLRCKTRYSQDRLFESDDIFTPSQQTEYIALAESEANQEMELPIEWRWIDSDYGYSIQKEAVVDQISKFLEAQEAEKCEKCGDEPCKCEDEKVEEETKCECGEDDCPECNDKVEEGYLDDADTLDVIYEYVNTLDIDDEDKDVLATDLLMLESDITELTEKGIIDRIKAATKKITDDDDVQKIVKGAKATGIAAIKGAKATGKALKTAAGKIARNASVAAVGAGATATALAASDAVGSYRDIKTRNAVLGDMGKLTKSALGSKAKKLPKISVVDLGAFTAVLGAGLVTWGAYRLYKWVTNTERQLKKLKTETIPTLKYKIDNAASEISKKKHEIKYEKAKLRLAKLKEKSVKAKQLADLKKKAEADAKND
jgi:hypothetical protein